MAGDTATFSVQLVDETSGAANAAAGSLTQLKGKITADTQALREMQQAMRQLQGGTNVSIGTFKDLRAQIDAKKASIASSQDAFVKLGGVFGDTSKLAGETGDAFGKLGGMAQKIGVKELVGEVGGLHGGLGKLASAAARAGGAMGILVAAAVAVGVALAAVVIKLAEFALASSDAARTQNIMTDAAAGFSGAGEALQAAIDGVAGSTTASRAQLTTFGDGLMKAGLRGTELEKALQAVGDAASVGLDAGQIAGQMEAAAKAGQSIDAVADKIVAKFGGLASKAALGFTNQLSRARENMARIFSGINLEAFLGAVHDVVGLLDQSTASGQALKEIMTSVLQPLFDAASIVGPYVKNIFRGMIVAALLIGVAIMTIKKAITDTFGGGSARSAFLLKVAFYAGVAAGLVLVGILLAIGAALAVLAGLVLIAMLPFIIGAALVVAAILLVVAVVYFLVDTVITVGKAIAGAWGAAWDAVTGALSSAYDAVAGFVGGFMGLGGDLIQGFVDGIKNGIGAVMSAVTSLGENAMGALKSVLHFGSPSKVFAEFGNLTSQGFAQGVDKGSDKVDASVSDMVTIPSGSDAKDDGAAAPKGGGKSGGIQIGQITVQTQQHEDLVKASFWSKVAEAIEDAAAAGGISTQPEAAA